MIVSSPVWENMPCLSVLLNFIPASTRAREEAELRRSGEVSGFIHGRSSYDVWRGGCTGKEHTYNQWAWVLLHFCYVLEMTCPQSYKEKTNFTIEFMANFVKVCMLDKIQTVHVYLCFLDLVFYIRHVTYCGPSGKQELVHSAEISISAALWVETV